MKMKKCNSIIVLFPYLGPCVECICKDYTGHICNASKVCDDKTNCDLLGLPKAYWLDVGKPTIPGDDQNSEFGKRKTFFRFSCKKTLRPIIPCTRFYPNCVCRQCEKPVLRNMHGLVH